MVHKLFGEHPSGALPAYGGDSHGGGRALHALTKRFDPAHFHEGDKSAGMYRGP